MKKTVTLILVLIVMLVSVFGGAAGCTRNSGEEFDETKSHLYFGFYNAGFGSDYAKDLKARFEEFYENEEFEPGKTGVQVHLLDVPQGNAFMSSVSSSDVDVFFTSNTDYYDYVRQGLILNIDDVVKDNLNKYGENKSIESRMSEAAREFFKTDDGYYGVPYVNSYSGMAMNVDLWEDRELYFAKGGCPSEYLRTNPNCDPALEGEWDDAMYEFTGVGEKSAGPDGQYDTLDDGEPATFEEFFVFCDRCYDVNVQAFHWPGKYQWTFSQPMIQMACDFEGAEQFGLQYSFNGTAKTLISVDESGNITKLPETEITAENGYMLYQQEGIYRVLDFFDKLLANKNYYDENTCLNNATHTHTDAQDDFVSGGILPGKDEIAILVDGEWWWTEAQPAFDVVEEYSNGEYMTEDRRFKMLSLPKATNDKVGEPFTILINGDGVCAINANIDDSKVVMAKEFVKFAFTNESNLQFLKHTSCCRDFEYDFNDEFLGELNFFQKSVLDTYERSEVCFVGSKAPLFIYNSFTFFNMENFWMTKIDGIDHDTPMTALEKEGKSAIEYFRGMATAKSKTFWDRKYSDFYEVD